ncbi:MAG: sigma-54 dependent transcriptional regulator [Polyangiaceae bacterium]
MHKRSRRAAGPLVAINCAAVPSWPLLESELFGHAKGAFTDAKSARRGLFVEASGGTLFLDELGEMPLGMQAKLLRALEERKVRPVGGSEEIEFDVRVVAATNRDLETLVTEKKFREDLFYRVNVVHVDLPPLRSRGQDVLLLTHLFIQRMNARHGKAVTGLCTAAAERLLAYDWPGNVRELLNCIERSVALATGPEITVADLHTEGSRDFKASTVSFGGTDPAELVTLEELEHRYIRRVMETVQWNKTEAARPSSASTTRPSTRKLDRYDIKGPT